MRASARLRRLSRLPLVLVALALAFALSRHWPTDQTLHIVLGDAAMLVGEVRVRYAEADSGASAGGTRDWQREVSFHFADGRAPRVVSHAPRLASGDYDVEVEVAPRGGTAAPRAVTTTRRVHFEGGVASVDVSAIVRDSLGQAAPASSSSPSAAPAASSLPTQP